MQTIAIIPARYGSTRFPGKPLVDIAGKPLVVHAMHRAKAAKSVHEVFVATDDERISDAVRQYGGKVIMTSEQCHSGSDRIAEALLGISEDPDIVVNLQGDEPMMPPGVIDRCVEALIQDEESGVSTAMVPIVQKADYESKDMVKVVCDQKGRALYFSRSPIPSISRADQGDLHFFAAQAAIDNPKGYHIHMPFYGYRHFGLYVYRKKTLLQFVKMQPTPLERVEKLEQLRLLENGVKIRVIEANVNCLGVDTPEDLERVKNLM